jgi:hypothetical protein
VAQHQPAPTGAKGRRRRDGNHSLQKKKIQYKVQWKMKKMIT